MSDVTYTIWLILSQDFKSEMLAYLRDDTPPVQFPAIADIDDITKGFFRAIHAEKAYERLFKSWSAAGRVYRVWGFNESKPARTQVIKGDMDTLMATYDKDFTVAGAWRYDNGEPVGGRENPWYPSPPELLNFMPDKFVPGPDPENPEEGATWEPATELSSVTGLVHQAPKVFV